MAQQAALVGFAVSPLNATSGPTSASRWRPPGGAAVERIFTAAWPRRAIVWPEPSLLPVERRWELLGLGLCPTVKGSPRRWRRRLREPILFSCLEHCSSHPLCRSVAFSQQREECVVSGDACAASSLSWHVSYATFVAAGDTEAPAPLEIFAAGQSGASDSGNEAPHVFASASPRMLPLWKIFFESLRLAGDQAIVHLHNESDGDTVNASRSKRPWPFYDADFIAMRRRDRTKVGYMARAIWTSLARGARHAVLSDVDVQVFPGWLQVTQACTATANVCVTQQPGVFNERRKPFNSGFIAFRVDLVTMSLVLRLAAMYENQFLDSNPRKGLLEQEVLSNFLFDQAVGLWAVFHPSLVSIFVDTIPFQVLGVKVQHACGSHAGSRPHSLYRARRLYYSLLPLCLSAGRSGPQHPCCALHGYQRSVFRPDFPTLPPFLWGATYGPVPGMPLSVMGDSDFEVWKPVCEQVREERMYVWTLEHPLEDFLEGKA